MKRLMISFAAVLTTVLGVMILWQFRIVVISVLISLALAAALRPISAHLQKQSIIMRVVWLLFYLVMLGSFGFVLFLAFDHATAEIQLLGQTISVQDKWILPISLEGSPSQLAFITQLPPPSMLFEALTGDQGQLVLPALIGYTQGIGGMLSGLFMIIILSLYWSSNQVHFERLWLSLMPPSQRRQARRIWRTIETDTGAYIRSEVIQSTLAGLILGLGFWLLGSPYPAILAIVAALAWLIPVAGAFLAVILPLLIGMLTSSLLSLTTALLTLIVLITLQIWLEPRLFKQRWNNPILTMIILLIMADAFGLIGLLFAPPISAICQILWHYLVTNRAVMGASLQISDLKARKDHILEKIDKMDGAPIELISNAMSRLNQLIEKSESLLGAGLPAIDTPDTKTEK